MSKSRSLQIYARLPVFLQNVACTMAGIQMRRARYNRYFRDTLRWLEESQWWPLERQQAYQDEQLRNMIEHAYANVPYYREIMDARRLKPEDIRTTADLPKLPLLDKQTVRDRHQDLRARGWPNKQTVHMRTGGTTGKALELIGDLTTEPWQWATQWRHRQRFGCTYGDPFIVFAGRSVVPLSNMDPPIWRRNLTIGQTYVSIHHMTKQNMPALADYLQRRKVAYYCGYPSGLYLLATYLLDQGIRLRHPPRIVYTGAETLLPHQREAMRAAFQSDVADHYGATESCVFISECEKHAYHIDMEFGAVEFLPIDGLPDNVRRIVATGFHNRAMPLIRYEIGDIATLSDQRCTCGRAAPIIEKIDGRIESYIITPDGRQLGRLDFLFKETHGIEEAQLVQTSPERVLVNIVPNRRFRETDMADLLANVRKYLGDVIAIDIKRVDTIPREANGKFRQIVSQVLENT